MEFSSSYLNTPVLSSGKPKVFVNGEKLPRFGGKKRNVDEMVEEDEGTQT